MRVPFDGEVWVHYGQLYVTSSPDMDGLTEIRAGQSNGLCGAAQPGLLFLTTGLHTGTVGFRVEVHDTPPPVDDTWEEIVEASYMPESGHVLLSQWAGEAAWPLPLDVRSYRVRYSGTGMDAAHQADTSSEPIDRYLLQFWPAPPEPDRVLKQTSATAAYWHQHARSLPPPPTPAERAATAQAKARARAQHEADLRRHNEERQWAGRAPSDRLRTVGGNVLSIAHMDRDLLDDLAGADPAVQRAVARWAARRAFTAAGLTDLHWVAPALAALDRGEPLPPPFDDHRTAFDQLFADPHAPRTTVHLHADPTKPASQQAMAVPALLAANDDDPLRAAIDATHAAIITCGDQHQALTELREHLSPRSPSSTS